MSSSRGSSCPKDQSESEVVLLCPALCDPMDCSLPGFSIHGISQARAPEWGAIAFSTQGSNLHLLGLLHWQPDSLPEATSGKPI